MRAFASTYAGQSFADRLHDLRRARQLVLNRRDTLLDVVRAVHASVEPEDIGQAVADRLISWIPLTAWTVASAEVMGHVCVLASAGHASPPADVVTRVAAHVMREGAPLVTGDLRLDPRLGIDYAAAVVALPLLGRDHTPVGAVVGLDDDVSTPAASLGSGLTRALESLLCPAGFALDSALLLMRLEALSVTDDLTRLYNARYLNITLRRETRLAHRTGRPVSLLFIDLDGFKSVNDTHGHLAGSRALIEAASMIRGSARETDIVARFGGDEFALVLPDTGSHGALAVAERIRERLAHFSFLAGDGLDVHLTASIGAATLPDVAATPDELVQAADAAMYQVKDRGKNGVQAAAVAAREPAVRSPEGVLD
jgi:diguanylate cyclase (GGDEF)-like protein